MKRRSFLASAAGMIAAFVSCAGDRNNDSNNVARAVAGEGEVKLDGLVLIGKAYLDSRTEPVNAKTLRRQLGVPPANARDVSPLKVGNELLGHHLSDLDHDNVLQIDGWIFTRTEARLYALLAIEKGYRPAQTV